MDNYLMLDGKKYLLSDKLAEKIKEEVALSENPFERKPEVTYYYFDSDGYVHEGFESRSIADDQRYQAANYCLDKELMEQRALHETLNRLLWRYKETHGGDIPWDGENHYYIYFHKSNNFFDASANDAHHLEGVVYFKDMATAEAAIEEVVKPFMAAHPDFIW